MLYFHNIVVSIGSNGKSPPPKLKKKFYYWVDEAFKFSVKFTTPFCGWVGCDDAVWTGATYFFSITFENIIIINIWHLLVFLVALRSLYGVW